MKRIGWIFDKIISIDNLRAAHYETKRSKKANRRDRAERYERRLEKNLQKLHRRLLEGTWHMHKYINRRRCERGKVRDIWYSANHEDSIVQHAILRVLAPLVNKKLIRHTYASIKGRGAHDCVKRLIRFIRSVPEGVPIWILKVDIRHFYQNIPHWAMHRAIDHFIEEQATARLLHGIIDSFPWGLPIGNALSPMFANMLLSATDHEAKEKMRAPVYHRYLDDMVVIAIGNMKSFLRSILDWMSRHINMLGLQLKNNMQIFPIERHGLDFLGYVYRRTETVLRKKTERRFRRAARRWWKGSIEALHRLSSYWGITKWLSRGWALWFKLLPADIHTMHKWAKMQAMATI